MHVAGWKIAVGLLMIVNGLAFVAQVYLFDDIASALRVHLDLPPEADPGFVTLKVGAWALAGLCQVVAGASLMTGRRDWLPAAFVSPPRGRTPGRAVLALGRLPTGRLGRVRHLRAPRDRLGRRLPPRLDLGERPPRTLADPGSSEETERDRPAGGDRIRGTRRTSRPGEVPAFCLRAPRIEWTAQRDPGP